MKNLPILFLSFILIFSSCQSQNESKQNPEDIKKQTKDSIIQALHVDALQLLCSIDNSYYFIDEPRENIYLYSEVQADFYSNENKKRTPLNLCIVIDRSGSMSGDKLNYAKEAAIFAINQLNENDFVSIISYGSDVSVVLEPSKVSNKQNIINKIIGIQSNGGTFLSGGMLKAYKSAKKTYDSKYLNRVFLLSDGLANEGIINQSELSAIASNWKENEHISLSTFGIGLDYNEDLMTELSEYGSGNYYFINNPKNIKSIFEKELNGLSSLVAKNTSMGISYPENMLKLEKVYGYKYKEVPGKIHISFGDIFSEEKKAVLVKFSITELTDNSIELLTKVNFTSMINEKNETKTLQHKLLINATKEMKLVSENIDSFTMQQAILFESNDAIEQAAIELDAGNFDKARKILQLNSDEITTKANSYGYTPELKVLEETNTTYEAEISDFESLELEEQKFIQKSNKTKAYELKKKK